MRVLFKGLHFFLILCLFSSSILTKSLREIATKCNQQSQVDRLIVLFEKWLALNSLSQADEKHVLQSIEIAKYYLKWNEERLPELIAFYETLPEEEDYDYDEEEDVDDDDGAMNIYLNFKTVFLSIILFLSFIYN